MKLNKLSSTNLSAKILTATIDQSIYFINLLSIACILALTISFILQYRRPEETYFYRSLMGQNVQMDPIKEINVSPKTLLNWAMVAVTNAYTMDFLNYEKSLKDLREFFTENGYIQFKQSLNDKGRLQDIISKKLIASAVVVDSPIVLKEGKFGKNGYIWEIQLPIAITYQGATVQTYKQWLAINLLVKKVPASDAKKGIGIDNIIDNTISQNY